MPGGKLVMQKVLEWRLGTIDDRLTDMSQCNGAPACHSRRANHVVLTLRHGRPESKPRHDYMISFARIRVGDISDFVVQVIPNTRYLRADVQGAS